MKEADAALEEYACEIHGQIEDRSEEGIQAKTLTWQRKHWIGDKQIGYSISLLSEELPQPILKIYGATWSDDEEKLKRYALHLDEYALQLPVDSSLIRDTIRAYGHTLRLFGAGEENGNSEIADELKKLSGPKIIKMHTQLSDLTPRN